MMRFKLLTCLAVLALAGPLAAQLQVPGQGAGVPQVGDVVRGAATTLDDTLEGFDEQVRQQARSLLRARDRTLARLLRSNRDVIERDANGELARRGELLAIALGEQQLSKLINAGFASLGREEIVELGIWVTRLAVPQDMKLAVCTDIASGCAAYRDRGRRD